MSKGLAFKSKFEKVFFSELIRFVEKSLENSGFVVSELVVEKILIWDHSYITSVKGLVGGFLKCQILLTFSTVFFADILSGWVIKSPKIC